MCTIQLHCCMHISTIPVSRATCAYTPIHLVKNILEPAYWHCIGHHVNIHVHVHVNVHVCLGIWFVCLSLVFLECLSLYHVCTCTCILHVRIRAQWIPLCVFRFILQTRQQSQYHTRQTWNQASSHSKVVALVDVQQRWADWGGAVSQQGKQTTAVHQQTGHGHVYTWSRCWNAFA